MEAISKATVGLRVNAPQVVHETIDGEVIIINLASGVYYSIEGSGAEVWDLLQQAPGLKAADIVAALEPHFDCSQAELEVSVLHFLDELREEGLIGDTERAAELGSGAGLPQMDGDGLRQAFREPALQKYTDMQDLVLLDPVHEVSDEGWPERRPDLLDPRP